MFCVLRTVNRLLSHPVCVPYYGGVEKQVLPLKHNGHDMMMTVLCHLSPGRLSYHSPLLQPPELLPCSLCPWAFADPYDCTVLYTYSTWPVPTAQLGLWATSKGSSLITLYPIQLLYPAFLPYITSYYCSDFVSFLVHSFPLEGKLCEAGTLLGSLLCSGDWKSAWFLVGNQLIFTECGILQSTVLLSMEEWSNDL